MNKEVADALIADGEYASFSDLARTAIRDAVMERKYKAIIDGSKREEALGTATILNGPNKNLHTGVWRKGDRV